MIFGDLPMIPFILVITLQNRKSLFCVFLSFRDLNEVKRTWDFSSVNISSREASGALGPHETSREAQKRPGGAPSPLGRATCALSPLDLPICWFFSPTSFVWPKNYYIKTPWGFLGGRRRRNTKTPKQRLYRRRLEGETPPEAPVEGSLPCPTPPPASSWWRGSSPPPGLWVCGGNLI